MKDQPLRIAIVGCGTAGPAAAVLLKRQGHDVILFERAKERKAVDPHIKQRREVRGFPPADRGGWSAFETP